MNINKKFKRLICFLGNYMPPPLNKYFYYMSGVKFENLNTTWIGTNCFFDNYNPELINIKSGVCLSFKVTIITHFDPTNSIKKPKIKKFSKKVFLERNCFIGANCIVYPGITVGENTIVSSGIIINENIDKNLLVKYSNNILKKKLVYDKNK